MVKRLLTNKTWNAWLIIACCGLFYCYQYILRVIPNTLSQDFMLSFQVDAAGFGLIIAFYSIAYAGLQLPLGIMFDRIKIKNLLPIAPIICAIASIILSYSDDIIFAAIARFLMGVGAAFGFIGTVKVATLLLPSNKISLAIGFIILSGTIGAGLGGRPMKYFADIYGWREVMIYIAVIGMIISAILLVALSSERLILKQEKSLIETRPIFQDLKLIFSHPQIILLSFYGLLMYLPITIFGVGWGMDFVRIFFSADYNIAANAIFIMFIGAGVGGPIAALISEAIKSRKIVMIAATIVALAMYSFLLYSGLALNQYIIYICFFIIGVAYAAKTLSFTLACELMPLNVSALTTATLNMTVMASGIIFHPLVGYLLDLGHEGDDIAYNAYDYKIALSVLPISAIISFLISLVIIDSIKKEHSTPDSKFISYDD
jgi:predicted MFS family arabinose efflux permease